MQRLFNEQEHVFRINASFGFILYNNVDAEYRYYYASQNNRIFENPTTIRNQDDFEAFMRQFEDMDILEWARQQRPNSKWVVHRITNITFFVDKLRKYPIGCPVTLPEYIRHSHVIEALEKDKKRGLPYTDHLCFFRCIARHQGAPLDGLEGKTQELYDSYCTKFSIDKKSFQGIFVEELEDLEPWLETNIFVYELCINEEEEQFAKLVRRSHGKFATTVYLHIYESHFSYIKNINAVTQTWSCRRCQKMFDHHNHCLRHELICTGNVEEIYPGGIYKSPMNVFEKLQAYGIDVPVDTTYPYRATYDFEAFFEDVKKKQGKLELLASHKILSVSVDTNVPGYEGAKCFINNGSAEDVARDMINYLTEVSQHAETLLMDTYQPILHEIDELLKKARKDGEVDAEDTDEEDLDEEEKTEKKHPLENLKQALLNWLRELPVLGFNSSKYDINMIKSTLMPVLLKDHPLQYVVKTGGSKYMCLKTENLKFLDILNYLAPGFSYAKFLKAYGAKEEKGFFPYEHMTSLEKLDETSLPPREAFYSSLTEKHIDEEDYALCQKVWKDNGMRSMRDFLIWYNNKDVTPFLQALQTMFDFYKSYMNVDMFKDAISVPGLTLKILFNTIQDPEAFFYLCGENDKDMYKLIKDQIVGGPSIIFHRYHEVGKTKLKEVTYGNQAKDCANIIGLDANALYLWSLMQEMPTGIYTRRREETGFKAESPLKWGFLAKEWLQWIEETEKIKIQHQFNGGEKRIGAKQLPVDGFCQSTHTVYQFHGCYWHGHSCKLTSGKEVNEKRGKTYAELQEETQKSSEYIKAEGYNLVEIYECEWAEVKKIHDISTSPQQKKIDFHQALEDIKCGKLFGLVQCDIRTPADLHKHFSEMPPIFKNVDVCTDDIGDFMKTYAEDHKIMSQPRRTPSH